MPLRRLSRMARRVPSRCYHRRFRLVCQLNLQHIEWRDRYVIEDLEGHLREWFAQHATGFAVIRPDRYVAAQADETSLDAAISRLRTLIEPDATEARK
jgi:hypothetical protein